jgi:hypothetical protein
MHFGMRVKWRHDDRRVSARLTTTPGEDQWVQIVSWKVWASLRFNAAQHSVEYHGLPDYRDPSLN